MNRLPGQPPAPPRAIPILHYGPIGAPRQETDGQSASLIPADTFGQQMGWLREQGYTALSLGQLEPYLRGERIGKVVGLTLDAAATAAEHALPLLRAHGFTATCFAVSGRLGQAAGGAGAPTAYQVMDAGQLRQWVAAGHEVGAHSRSHADLRTLDEAAAWSEIAGCKDDLERATGTAVRHYCYPHGGTAPVLTAMVRAAGYATASTITAHRVRRQDDFYALAGLSVSAAPCPQALWLRLTLGIEPPRPV